MRFFVVFCLLAAATAQSDFYLCEYVVPSFCAQVSRLNIPQNDLNIVNNERQSCMAEPSFDIQGETYKMTNNFNVISFQDFNAGTEDTEGRVAVKRNGNVGTGYSIGALLYSMGVGATDAVLPYSAMFGGNLTWSTGELYPVGSDAAQVGYADTTAAYTEYLYVGDDLTTDGSDAGLGRRLGSKLESFGTFDSSFNDAQSFYSQLQQSLNALTDNAAITIQPQSGGTASLTCAAGTSATSYSVHVDASVISQITSWVVDSSCAPSVQMVITVTGSGDCTFQDNGFTAAQRDPSRTVFNMLNSGNVIMSSINFAGILLAPNSDYSNAPNTYNVVEGIMIVGDVVSSGQFNRINCSVPVPPAQPKPCVGFEAVCAGTTFTAPDSTVTSDTRDYNVISFDSFTANTGDVEGRVMVRNDFTCGNGFSIGYMTQAANGLTDNFEDYALLAGGVCNFGSGAVYPDGSNMPWASPEESIFCGSSFSGPSDLSGRTESCGVAGCLNSIFDAAYTCYSGYSTGIANTADSVTTSIGESALTVTCSDNTAEAYSFTIDAADLTQFTYYVNDNCNIQAEWTINIGGTADVYFSGDSFFGAPGSTVYNVPGDRTIYVTETALNGHLLAPDATLNQTGGVILGKVVAGDVEMMLQINKENYCQTLTNTPVPIQNGPTPVNPGTPTICPTTPGVESYLIVGNSIVGGNFAANTVITSFDDNTGCATLNNAPATYIAAGSKAFSVMMPSNSGGGQPVQDNKSSASAAVVSVALLAVALLF